MNYVPVLMLLVAALGLGVVVMTISGLLGPKLPNSRKNMPFECGVPPHHDAKTRFSVRFYLIAILFLLFDVEAIFFFPFAIVFREYIALNSAIIWTMGFFVSVLLVGYFYVLRKGALEWD
jgi:NADH-quinone oxidoreductase subunit A